MLEFGAAKHFMTKNPEGIYENPNYSNIQLEYVGKLTKLKFLERRLKMYYMLLPFIIPKLIDKYNPGGASPGYAQWWGIKENGLTLFEF